MRKVRFSFLAFSAIVAAGALLAAGCKQPGGQADKPSGGGTVAPDNKGGTTEKVDTGTAVELRKTFDDMGTLIMTIKDGGVTVYFQYTKKNMVYTGNGTVGKGGAVEFNLHAVDNAADTIPFKGVYKSEEGVFELHKLTEGYPYHTVELIKKYQGTARGYQQNFVRYVHGLENPFTKGEKISAAFFITLDHNKVLITAVYGNDHIGMRSVSKNAYLEGNKVVTPMKIADTDYDVELTFNEDARETSETTDERTVWYLGRRNSEENISKGGAEYVGGLRLYRTKPVSPNNPVLEDKVFVKKHYNLVDASYKALGTLDLTIRGQEVTFALTQAAGLGEQSGATQIRRVRLVKSTVREGLYESEKMKSAQVTVGNGAAKKSIMSDGTGTYGNSETVFVFRNTSDLTNTDVEKHKYNTYEFLVTECNPKDGTFFLKGWHLLDKAPTDAEKGGQPVQASAQTTVFYNEGTGAKRLDGGLFNGKDAK